MKVDNKYITEHLKKVGLDASNITEEKINTAKSVMEKYTTKWWESDDKTLLARCQLFEPILLVKFSDFQEGLEQFLGRGITTIEFGFFVENLKDEVIHKIKELDKNN
ncbi:MAG: hypothetical protein WC783_03375 [Candidatus Paceibacterota bacterium]|jgi:hypothetical protein